MVVLWKLCSGATLFSPGLTVVPQVTPVKTAIFWRFFPRLGRGYLWGQSDPNPQSPLPSRTLVQGSAAGRVVMPHGAPCPQLQSVVVAVTRK